MFARGPAGTVVAFGLILGPLVEVDFFGAHYFAERSTGLLLVVLIALQVVGGGCGYGLPGNSKVCLVLTMVRIVLFIDCSSQ